MHYHLCAARTESRRRSILYSPAVVNMFTSRDDAFAAAELENAMYDDVSVAGCLLSHDWDGVLEQMAQGRRAFNGA